MSDPMPSDATALMDHQAELTDLRWVAGQLMLEHARGAYPIACLCRHCRAAKRWLPVACVSPVSATTPPFSLGRR